MKADKFKQLVNRNIAVKLDLLESKGADYCQGDENIDRLLNFKRLGIVAAEGIYRLVKVAYVAGRNGESFDFADQCKKLGIRITAYVYLMKHIDRIAGWVKSGAVKSESLGESCVDAGNYADLIQGLAEDLENGLCDVDLFDVALLDPKVFLHKKKGKK